VLDIDADKIKTAARVALAAVVENKPGKVK
jgi:hypothetical protein